MKQYDVDTERYHFFLNIAKDGDGFVGTFTKRGYGSSGELSSPDFTTEPQDPISGSSIDEVEAQCRQKIEELGGRVIKWKPVISKT